MTYLQYVQPTGNRSTYTNTGIYVDDTEFEFRFDYLYFPQQIQGGDWSEVLGTGYPSKFRVGSNPKLFMMYGSNDRTYSTTGFTLEGQVTINKTGLYCDGVQLISYTASTPSADYLTIGGDYGYPSDALVDSTTKLGRFKVYHNSVLVGDFVPAENNGVVGWYDEVGQTFYDSDGANPWIAGPPLTPTADKSIYMGEDEVVDVRMGEEKVVMICMGEDLIYSAAPLTLEVSPATISFNDDNLTGSLTINSRESWTLTAPAWITADIESGGTGVTIVSLTATTQTATTSGSIEVVTTNYSASTEVKYLAFSMLSYIETDGNCYFDTNIIPDINTKIEAEITPLVNTTNWNGFIGAQNGDDTADTFQIRRNNNNTKFEPKVDSHYVNVDYATGQTYTLSLDKDNFVINGVSYTISASTADTCNYTLYIGAIHNPSWENSTPAYRAGKARFGEIKIYSNGTLVADLMPAQSGNDYGFYDTVADAFRPNLGSGTPTGA